MLSYIKSRQKAITKKLQECQHLDFYTTYTSSPTWPCPLKKTFRLLVLDSSFNPPTRAHANLLTKSLEAFGPHYFDATLLLFSTNNVDKQFSGANLVQRAQMMELMALNYTNSAVGFMPHGRFIDKATHIHNWFREKYNNHDLDLHFIMGYDTLIRFMDPKYYPKMTVKEALAPFFKNCRLICADRGVSSETFWSQLKNDGYEDLIKRIQLDPVMSVFSSTLARNAIRQGDDTITNILDIHILDFIEQEANKIYQT